jgi:hypothetical protein
VGHVLLQVLHVVPGESHEVHQQKCVSMISITSGCGRQLLASISALTLIAFRPTDS